VSQPSLSFDHAADFYDATRALPDHAIAGLTDALLHELHAVGAPRALEVGVGTGRIARPLAARGIRVSGIDIAPRMMHRLAEQLGPQHTPPDLILADGTALPFASHSFPAVVISHILHLIPDWQRAVAEILRVLSPGAVLLSTYEENDGPSDWDPSAAKWTEMLDARAYIRPRTRANSESINAALTAAGGACEAATAAEWDETSTPGQELDYARNRIHSWSWEIPDDIFLDCLPEFERWALDTFGDLQRPLHRRAAQRLQTWRFA